MIDLFHDLTVIHHRQPVCQEIHHFQIMADQQIGQVFLFL